MGRDIWPMEIDAFEQVYHYPPLGIDILTGSLDQRNKGFALVVFVNADNPIGHLSLEQLERVFSGKNTAHTWGELGVTGEWADEPIHTYGFEIHRGFGYYMQQKVFHGSALWNPDMVELGDVKQPDGRLLDAGQRIVDAVASDPYAVGYSSLLYKNAGAKPISLGPAEGQYVAATNATVEDRTYPLVETVACYINRAPGEPVDPKLMEFFRYIFSQEGHAIAVKAGGYIPLPAGLATQQLRKLE
jgi:phosphate transport system substrate-binding protein